MKNNPLTTILLGALAISAIWSAILCIQFIRNSRELRAMQADAARINNQQMTAQAILNDAVDYSKKNPAIEPLLETLGVKKPSTPTPNPTAPAVKPSTR
jgi:hypothetical protein